MTLLLGMMNRRQAILVADRRVTADGRLVEDESNKAFTFVCRDARLAFAFTGLASIGSFVTGRWLLDALGKAAEPDSLVKPTLDRFTRAATEKFGSLAVPQSSDKRLSVLCVGYTHDESGPRGMFAVISNFERSGQEPAAVPEPEFAMECQLEKRPPGPSLGLLIPGGMVRALSDKDFTAIQGLLHEDEPAKAIVGLAVESLRRAADSPAARNSIGKQCSSIVLPSNPEEEARSEYHSAVRSYVVHDVSHIQAIGGEFGMWEIADHQSRMLVGGEPIPVAGPKLRRNEPCWCGAKEPDGRPKKYKRCHGR